MAVIGALTLKKVSNRRELFLASIPFLFATQQLIEGLLWLALLNENAESRHWLTQAYVVYACVLWPILIPLSLFLIEPDKRRKIFIVAAMCVGTGIAAVTLQKMISAEIKAEIVNYCVRYDYSGPEWKFAILFYLVATCVPFFVSSYRNIQAIGFAILASFLLAYYAYQAAYVSVWCFFAAAISGFIYLHGNAGKVGWGARIHDNLKKYCKD